MNIKISFLVLVALSLLTGCLKDDCTETRTFVRFEPVYRSQTQIDAPITVLGPRALENPGIIYVYQHRLLINEFREGIHVFDNTDPANPINEAFIGIEGNEHFAVYKDRLQANKFNSLITLDISDVTNPTETSRVRNAFDNIWEDPNRGFLVYHEQVDQTMTLDCSDPNFNSVRWSNNTGGGGFWVLEHSAAVDRFSGNVAVPESQSGTGGSTARFTIAAQHLYTVSQSELKVFDLVNPSRPRLSNSRNMGWGIETIYPFRDRLFIGSETGMFIYDIAVPDDPQFLSSFEHARACDPVVADDNTAFVTLRDGTRCEGFNNQLDVIDIEDLTLPRLINTYAMDNPHGLALSGDVLYICEGEFGLKAFDVSDREDVQILSHLKGSHAYDVIALTSDHLLVVGKDGLQQYNSSDPKKLNLISEIPIVKLP